MIILTWVGVWELRIIKTTKENLITKNITKKLKNFYEKCINDFDLNIIGLMCIPPITDNVQDFFIKMSKLNSSLNLSELSMGMSQDYLDAINYGATYVRIGSNIFGQRS